ncbi:response regulator [Candidatus Bathyarchaeota archaeon]|nr:MAG: response regulator [Candidatus Bathyarchaeota archaeon]
MAEAKSPFKFAVLVVDDNEGVCDLIEQFLQKHDIKVYTASGAEKALRLTTQHDHIKIVITDLHMPESCIDGKSLALILMEREPRTIVYAITGHADKFLLDDCLRVGFRDYFVKPIKMDMILKSVRASCEQIKRWEEIR